MSLAAVTDPVAASAEARPPMRAHDDGAGSVVLSLTRAEQEAIHRRGRVVVAAPALLARDLLTAHLATHSPEQGDEIWTRDDGA